MTDVTVLIMFGIGVLVLIAVDAIVCACRTIVERIRLHHHRQAHRDIAGSLEMAAYWFCEDPNTEELINALAKHIREYGTIHPDYIRREWRKRRSNTEVKQS